MGKVLTKIAAENATAKQVGGKAVRTEVPDGSVQGLYLIVQPSGAKSWAVRYRVDGVPRKHTLGPYPRLDVRGARDAARIALGKVGEGEDPAAQKKANRAGARATDTEMVEKVVGRFIDGHAKKKTRESSWREAQRILNREIVAVWTGRSIHSITKKDVISLVDSVVDRGSPIMANRVLAHTRKLLNWCVEKDLIQFSPAVGVRPPSNEESRDRILSDHEIPLIWSAAEQLKWPFGPIIRLLLLTGQRREEVGNMKWSELDLAQRLWTIPKERTKNGRAHEVPLSDAAMAILEQLPHIGTSGLLFTTNGETAVSGYSRAKRRLDGFITEALLPEASAAEPWTFHDLRRTVATGMAKLGVPLPVTEKVLNHISGSFAGIVGVYQLHDFAPEKRKALAAWSDFVEGLVSSPPAGAVSNVIEMPRARG